MKTAMVVLIVVLGLLASLPTLAADQVPEIDATTLNKWISDGKDLVLIDVGSRGDFAEAHISGSFSLPFDTSFPAETNKLSTVKTYVLVCPTGRRSLRAAKVMMESGFENVYSLKGGITDWIRHGFKVVKGEAKASENTASSAPALPTPTAPAGDSVAALKPAIITYLNGAAGSADYMMAAGAAKESLDKNRDAWLVLDIRKPDGYAKGHIPGAINVWFSDIGANFDKIRAAARGKTVIAVCEIGVGSGQVAALLNLAGVKAVDLEDGMGQNSMGRANGKGWLEAGYPAATESTAMPDTPAAADSPDPIVLHAVRDYFLKLPADFNVIKPTDFKELRDTMAANPDAYAFLDIRKPEDFARGHIAGSINYAFGPDLANHLDAVAEKAKGKTLIVVSASGQTAGQAVAVLNLIGIRAKDLALGFAGWNKFVKGELKVSEGEK